MSNEQSLTGSALETALRQLTDLVRHYRTGAETARKTGISQPTISVALRSRRVGPRVGREIDAAWRAAGLGPPEAVQSAYDFARSSGLLEEAIEAVSRTIGSRTAHPMLVLQQIISEDAKLRRELNLPAFVEKMMAETLASTPKVRSR